MDDSTRSVKWQDQTRAASTWGLPFFFGRTVFTAIEGQTTPGGVGPYFAF